MVPAIIYSLGTIMLVAVAVTIYMQFIARKQKIALSLAIYFAIASFNSGLLSVGLWDMVSKDQPTNAPFLLIRGFLFLSAIIYLYITLKAFYKKETK